MFKGAADGVFVGTVEAVGTVVKYSQRLLLQARRLGAAGDAEGIDVRL